jgi:CTP synthase
MLPRHLRSAVPARWDSRRHRVHAFRRSSPAIPISGRCGKVSFLPVAVTILTSRSFALIHVSLVPLIGGEQKTKPTQASIRDLRGLGLAPDLVRPDISCDLSRKLSAQIACRCEQPLDRATTSKISMFCHVGSDQVLGVHNVASVYHVPLLLREQGIIRFLQRRLALDQITVDADRLSIGTDIAKRWRELTISHDRLFDKVHIVLVGKYTSLQDSYMSVIKSLEHAALRCHRKLILEWVDSEHLEEATQTKNPRDFYAAWQSLCSASCVGHNPRYIAKLLCSGVLVPGGFGHRGTEGMILAVKWAREKKIPFLGICLGFQMAVVEYARNVCGVAGESSVPSFSAPPPLRVYNWLLDSLLHIEKLLRRRNSKHQEPWY